MAVAAEELAEAGDISEASLFRLAAFLDEPAMVEFVLLASRYRMRVTVTKALRIRPGGVQQRKVTCR
jgi:alkylhydroperoxidase family enzyme